MQSLKADLAREVSRKELVEAETLVYEGRIISQSGKQTMLPGEFYFRPNTVPLEEPLPSSWLGRCYWKLTRREQHHGVKIVHTVLIACPFDGQPILSTFSHKILSREPLTIDREIACPYSQFDKNPHAFAVNQRELGL